MHDQLVMILIPLTLINLLGTISAILVSNCLLTYIYNMRKCDDMECTYSKKIKHKKFDPDRMAAVQKRIGKRLKKCKNTYMDCHLDDANKVYNLDDANEVYNLDDANKVYNLDDTNVCSKPNSDIDSNNIISNDNKTDIISDTNDVVENVNVIRQRLSNENIDLQLMSNRLISMTEKFTSTIDQSEDTPAYKKEILKNILSSVPSMVNMIVDGTNCDEMKEGKETQIQCNEIKEKVE